MSWTWKKGPNFVHPWVESSIQNTILRGCRKKCSKIFPWGAFLVCFWRKVYWSALILQNFPCPETFLVAHLIIESFACILQIFVVIFLLPVIFFISFEICLIPKLLKYAILLSFTFDDIQWFPIGFYSSRFITFAPSFI